MMSIVLKSHLVQEQKELERYWLQLQEILKGGEASGNLAHHYRYTPEIFERDFADIDLIKLKREIKHFKIALEGLEDSIKDRLIKAS